MRLARVAVLLLFLAGFYALMFFGGDQVAQATDSRWLAALLGLVASVSYAALFFWAEKLVKPASDINARTELVSVEDEAQQVGPVEIVALLSLVVILGLASFGYSGTPVAFLAGLLGGFLLTGVVAQHFTKPSLQS